MSAVLNEMTGLDCCVIWLAVVVEGQENCRVEDAEG